MIDEATASDPRVLAALSDLERRILDRYPEATFEVMTGDDPDGVYLMATVDLEDTLEFLDEIMDRMLEVQTDEELLVYVIPIRPVKTPATVPGSGSTSLGSSSS